MPKLQLQTTNEVETQEAIDTTLPEWVMMTLKTMQTQVYYVKSSNPGFYNDLCCLNADRTSGHTS